MGLPFPRPYFGFLFRFFVFEVVESAEVGDGCLGWVGVWGEVGEGQEG